MKIILTLLALISIFYLLLLLTMFLFQRNLLYYPVPYQHGINRDEVSFSNNGLTLHGWILNPGKTKALIYFGGNSEAIENNIENFETIFKDHSVYLIHYRGYGKSEGKPTEAGLFSDAIAIYDNITSRYQSISLMGRSLGSGVAVYLAAKRQTEKLILLTPYDSIAEVAQYHYPFVPARLVARDRFESFRYAPEVTAPVLIITAELDRVVPVERALKLSEFFKNNQVTYKMVNSAAHNNVTDYPEYLHLLSDFVGRPVPVENSPN